MSITRPCISFPPFLLLSVPCRHAPSFDAHHGFHQLGHVIVVLADEPLERPGAQGARLDALAREPPEDHGVFEQLPQFRVDALDDGFGRARRREQPEPRVELVSGNAARRDRRHPGQERRAAARGDPEEADAIVLREGDRADVRHDHRVRARGEHVVGRVRRGLERDVHHVEFREAREIRHREMARAAVAGGGVVELSGIRSCVREELGDGLRGNRRARHEHVALHADVGDAREIADRVIRRVRAEQRRDVVARGGEDERLAVGRRSGHARRADRAARSGAVVDDRRLPERRAELAVEGARQHLARAARSERHDDAHHLAARLRRRGRDERDAQQRSAYPFPACHGETLTSRPRRGRGGRIYFLRCLRKPCPGLCPAASRFPCAPPRRLRRWSGLRPPPRIPGGIADITARVLAPRLAQALGQPVVVENRPAGGIVAGGEAVATAPPDGYTLLSATPQVAIVQSMVKDLAFDPRRGLAPIALVGVIPNVLVAGPRTPAKTLAELIELARRNPGKLNYSSTGAGTSVHLSAELLKYYAGIDIVHVPYRGAAAAMTALLAGDVDIMVDSVPPSLPRIRAGKVRALAVTSARRVPQLPEVPTMIESGYPDFEINGWAGVATTGGTPSAIIARLESEIRRALSQAQVVAAYENAGLTVRFMGAAEFGKFWDAEIAKFALAIRHSGAVKE